MTLFRFCVPVMIAFQAVLSPVLSPGALAAVAPPRSVPQTAAEIIPPLPAENANAAALYLEAVAILEAEDVWDTSLAALAAEVHSSVFSPSGRRSVVAWVDGMHLPEENNRQPSVGEAYDEFARRLESPAVIRALSMVSEAGARPACRFSVDYSKGAEALLPHLSKLRLLSRFLGAVGGLAVERGDAQSAWECVLWQLRLADALRTEPLLISQLVRNAILQMGIAGLQQAAGVLPPTPELWPALDRRLDEFDDSAPWVLALDGERLIVGEWLLTQPHAKVEEMLQEAGRGTPRRLTPEQLAAGRQAYAQAMLQLAEMAARPYHEVRDRIDAFPDTAGLGNPVVKALVPAVANVCRRAAETQASIRVTRIGLRAIREKATRGACPPDLAAMDLAGIPGDKQLDPFTGAPLSYRCEDDGFVLYSIGPDRTDDGGLARGADAKASHDIVWRTRR